MHLKHNCPVIRNGVLQSAGHQYVLVTFECAAFLQNGEVGLLCCIFQLHLSPSLTDSYR